MLSILESVTWLSHTHIHLAHTTLLHHIHVALHVHSSHVHSTHITSFDYGCGGGSFHSSLIAKLLLFLHTHIVLLHSHVALHSHVFLHTHASHVALHSHVVLHSHITLHSHVAAELLFLLLLVEHTLLLISSKHITLLLLLTKLLLVTAELLLTTKLLLLIATELISTELLISCFLDELLGLHATTHSHTMLLHELLVSIRA